MSKVFGVGWAKTGTTTLGVCLRTLGYRHQSHRMDLVADLKAGRLERIFQVVEEGESFEDWPWILLYKELDQRFPGSKFVLTVRDSSSWLTSYRNMLNRKKSISTEENERRAFLYGLPFPDVSDQQLVERYGRHNREVVEYFQGRPESLLKVNWSAGDGWPALCSFLGRDIPSAPFPHANRGRYRSREGLLGRIASSLGIGSRRQ